MTSEISYDHKNVEGDAPSPGTLVMVVATASCNTAALTEWKGEMGLDKQPIVRIRC